MEEISVEDPRYPELLRQIQYPPRSVFCLGAPPRSDEPAVAIVGTRKATPEGRLFARRLAKELSRAGLSIVSGLAIGIDGAAHEGALDGGGRTVAVLASGLDNIYPRAHEGLAKRIIESGGGVLSEYPPGTLPLQHRFLDRNRIIAGLALATVIVEAPEHSGALATARYAAESGRDVMVVPGAAGHPNYAGSHMLLRAGARLIASAGDVLEDIEIALQNCGFGPIKVDKATEEPGAEDGAIIGALKAHGPLTIDKLAELVNLETHIVLERLTYLMLRGRVAETQGRYNIKR
ncbi:DNA-processing protein DprA [Patescibacteria group bacterium]|nr:DNA-processing protein DprA [Patescibacteria group bacterium]